ncbi:MAG TPA: vitamin K epoxide reductase family protein [Candidatus Paceibacterota bacterium]|nr:vitamin K epoxide reductase family protein [Candidatus Paceibacterota bacterium]
MTRQIILAILIVLALIGLGDTIYLSLSAASDAPLVCDIGAGLDGCNIVAQSPYSRVFGIPLAAIGVVFYALLLVVSAVLTRLQHPLLERGLRWLTIVGSILSVGFLYIQFALIQALCIYCILSALLSFAAVWLAHQLKPPVLP